MLLPRPDVFVYIIGVGFLDSVLSTLMNLGGLILILIFGFKIVRQNLKE